ncbi:hypothetical protein D3C84_740380 [compost metagenome]
MAEADHHFLLLDAGADVGLGLVRVVVALLDLEGHLVGAAVLGPAQGADGAGDAAEHVGTGAGDHPRGEGGGVEFVLGVQVERGVHGAHPGLARFLAVQQMEEVAADGVVVGLHVDALAVVAEVVPVQQRRTQRSHQLVGDVAGARVVMVFLLRRHATEHRHGGAHHVHRVGGRRQLFEGCLEGSRDAAQGLELGLVASQFGDVGQLAVHQQVGDFFKFAAVGEVEDVIAAVMQVVAGAADGAQCGVAGSGAAQGYGFFRLEAWGGGFWGSAHCSVSSCNPVSGFPRAAYFLAANSASRCCSKAW